MGVFHEATRQAIREMIEEFGEASRFGRILNEDDLEGAAGRIATFFEMTLELRANLGGLGSALAGALAPERPSQGAQGSPRASTQRTNTLPPASGRMGLRAGFPENESAPSRAAASFPRTRAAAEVAVEHELSRGIPGGASSSDVRLAPQHDLRLPRTRVDSSDNEREMFASLRRPR
jgi:hypothetical protein